MRLSQRNFAVVSAAVVVSGFVSCEKPTTKKTVSSNSKPVSEEAVDVADVPEVIPEKKEKKTFERVTLPVDRVLRDSTGRELDATIVGRSRQNLTVVRRIDKRRLEVPISSLSQEDQAFARSVAYQVEEPAYIKTRKEEILRLEERIRRLEADILRSENVILKKTHRSQIKKSEEEIVKLKADIEFHAPSRPRE